jgi:hypothetical protein
MAGELIDRIGSGIGGVITLYKVSKELAPYLMHGVKIVNERNVINFDVHNNRASYRFWVCGTSLTGVVEHVVGKIKESVEYKIILPDTTPCTASRAQLLDMQKRTKPSDDAMLVEDQVESAEKIATALYNFFDKHNIDIGEHIKLYNGVMYQNITIYDDIAYISFYDATGIGNNNITLRCHGVKNPLYRRINTLFENMWKAGTVPSQILP